MITFAIGIPTLNRKDLLLPALFMYAKVYPNTPILVLDNGNQNIRMPPSVGGNITVGETPTNIGVASSWNYLCKAILKNHDAALILNDDIVLTKGEAFISELINKKKDCLLRSTVDWCAFVMPKRVFSQVGEFDDVFFPAYYEDKSYEYRMKLKHLTPVKTNALNPEIYRNSQTIEKAPEIVKSSIRNKQLYIDMWGGEPTMEKFLTPYNKKYIGGEPFTEF